MTVSALPLALGFLVGGILAGILVHLWARNAVAQERARLAGRLSSAETTALNERQRREELASQLRSSEADREEMLQALTQAQTQAAEARKYLESQKAYLDRSRQDLENAFKALAAGALEGNAQQFLNLAEERLSRSRSEAVADLDQRKQAIQSLVDPLKEVLVKLEGRTSEMEKARVDAYAKIDQHIRLLLDQTTRLQDKTMSLQTALRGSQVRGRWGEIALRNIAELSGMTEHCDFSEQVTLPDGKRPDMVVRLPGERFIAVDAKAPLTAYLTALEAQTEADRDAALDQHVTALRGHLRTLAGRDYADGLPGEMDMVVLFLPGDPYLAAALSRDPELLPEAIRSRVLIATPTTLVALLRTVAIYWQQRSVAENAEQIATTARVLYERASTFAEHLARMGKGLRSAVESYNQGVASFERRFLPMARQLEEMRVTEQSKRRLESPEIVDEVPRPLPSDTPGATTNGEAETAPDEVEDALPDEVEDEVGVVPGEKE
jgi:DNA recombination protein RmuC